MMQRPDKLWPPYQLVCRACRRRLVCLSESVSATTSPVGLASCGVARLPSPPPPPPAIIRDHYRQWRRYVSLPANCATIWPATEAAASAGSPVAARLGSAWPNRARFRLVALICRRRRWTWGRQLQINCATNFARLMTARRVAARSSGLII